METECKHARLAPSRHCWQLSGERLNKLAYWSRPALHWAEWFSKLVRKLISDCQNCYLLDVGLHNFNTFLCVIRCVGRREQKIGSEGRRHRCIASCHESTCRQQRWLVEASVWGIAEHLHQWLCLVMYWILGNFTMVGKSKALASQVGAIEAVVAVLRAHVGDANVSKKACGALRNICINSELDSNCCVEVLVI